MRRIPPRGAHVRRRRRAGRRREEGRAARRFPLYSKTAQDAAARDWFFSAFPRTPGGKHTNNKGIGRHLDDENPEIRRSRTYVYRRWEGQGRGVHTYEHFLFLLLPATRLPSRRNTFFLAYTYTYILRRRWIAASTTIILKRRVDGYTRRFYCRTISCTRCSIVASVFLILFFSPRTYTYIPRILLQDHTSRQSSPRGWSNVYLVHKGILPASHSTASCSGTAHGAPSCECDDTAGGIRGRFVHDRAGGSRALSVLAQLYVTNARNRILTGFKENEEAGSVRVCWFRTMKYNISIEIGAFSNENAEKSRQQQTIIFSCARYESYYIVIRTRRNHRT